MPGPQELTDFISNTQIFTTAPGTAWLSTNDVPQDITALKKRYKMHDGPPDEEATVASIFGVASPRSIPYSRIQEFLGIFPQYTRLIPDTKPIKTLIGIEVEVENVLKIDPQIPLIFWEIAEDGSLRNNGREFKSLAIPAYIAGPALAQLFDGLNKNLDFSHRTSVHVHLDARQLTPKQLTTFLVTYLVLENLLFKFADLSRRNNIFCVPLMESSLVYELNPDKIKSIPNLTEIWHKYTALNLRTLQDLGTLEFRHLPGTNNISKIVTWIRLITKLKIFSYKNSLESVMQEIEQLNTSSSYLKFVEMVFGPDTQFLNTSSLLVDMEKAVTAVKSSMVLNTFDAELFTGKTKNIKPSQVDDIRARMPDPFESIPEERLNLLSALDQAFAWKKEMTNQRKYQCLIKDFEAYLAHPRIPVDQKEIIAFILFGETP